MIPLNEMTVEQRSAIVDTGITFMKAIVDAAGNDNGLALWDKIGETLGPDIKGEILFSMLMGNDGRHITLVSVDGVDHNMIEVIKIIRYRTGLGLKESKDVYVAAKTAPQKIQIDTALRTRFLAELRELGCVAR